MGVVKTQDFSSGRWEILVSLLVPCYPLNPQFLGLPHESFARHPFNASLNIENYFSL
jgi:hypothetical protein